MGGGARRRLANAVSRAVRNSISRRVTTGTHSQAMLAHTRTMLFANPGDSSFPAGFSLISMAHLPSHGDEMAGRAAEMGLCVTTPAARYSSAMLPACMPAHLVWRHCGRSC